MNNRTLSEASHPSWRSAATRTLQQDISCAVQFGTNVMISGESGAGKQFVAQLIHQRRASGQAPFILATCQGLMESVLRNSVGSGSSASTVFIEDIETIPAPIQAQLHRFLESETRLGSDRRLMTATRTDLIARVRSNQFSEDLFYRLNCIHLVIPALRDRPEDIPVLFRHYLSLHARAEVPRLTTAAWDRLAAYSWPGNVRELKAVAETVAAQDLSRLVEPDDIPSHIGR